MMNQKRGLTVGLLIGLLATTAQAVTTPAVVIEFVPVGNPGNANDPETGYGRVLDPYLIGKYEVTNAQWREFLTAKASVTDPHGLYDTGMASIYGGIDRTWSVDHYVYTAKDGDANWDDRPVNYVSFWDASRFANWLHNGQGSGDTETGAYINVGNKVTFSRQPEAKYFIPTNNEWYKAAYYDPNKNGVGTPGYWDYPTMSDNPMVPSNDLTTPDNGNNTNFYQNGFTIGPPYHTTEVGEFENSASPYGTFDQSGNLREWNETVLAGSARGLRGGGWYYNSHYLQASNHSFSDPTIASFYVGFRVASVPEPGSITMLACGAVGLLAYGWRRKRYGAQRRQCGLETTSGGQLRQTRFRHSMAAGPG